MKFDFNICIAGFDPSYLSSLYKVWNSTKQRYPKNINRNNKWYNTLHHATRGLRAFSLSNKNDEFEIHKYVAVPKEWFLTLNEDDLNELYYVANNNPAYSKAMRDLVTLYDTIRKFCYD